MRILHIADVHWRGLSRHQEYILAFKDLFSQAKILNPDVIYIGGDIVHSKTQGISPELIECLCWWFNELAKIAPTHVILGNHDGLILNKDRQDAISPIINALNNPNIHLYKDSGAYPINDRFEWCVFSCFDEENWKKVKPSNDKISIALYHGAVTGSLTDIDWALEGEVKSSFFSNFDFAMLGDIHKRQFLNEKGTIAYCGSTIQQNYGETQEKGFLLWDIEDEDNFKVDFHPVKNDYSFVTVEWRGSVGKTVDACREYPNLTRFRIRADNYISQMDARNLQKTLLKVKNASEVVFKIDSKVETSLSVQEDVNKINFRDAGVHKRLIREYYDTQNLEKKELDLLDEMTEKYVSEVVQKDTNLRNIKWSINKIRFDNLFSYGPDNFINFENLPGITGIFGKNARGKSSIIGALAYSLYNTTDRGSIKNLHIINTRHSNCKTELDVSINNVPYRIIRSTVKKQNKSGYWAPTTLKLYRLNKTGEIIEDLTEEQRRETEKVIRKMIGGPEEFLMTSLASQGEMNMFIKEKAAARKSILTSFLDLSVFDKVNELAKKESNDLRVEARNISIDNCNKKIETLNNDIELKSDELSICHNDIKRTKKNIDSIRLELSEISEDLPQYVNIAEVTNAERTYKGSLTRQQNLQKDLDDLNDEVYDTEQKIVKISSFIDNYDIEGIKEKRTAQIRIERSLLEIENQHSLEAKELTLINKSVSKLNSVPCGEQFPTCRFIKDSHMNKKRLEKQEEKVTHLKTHVRDIKSAYRKIKNENYEAKIEKYNQILKKKSVLVQGISSTRVAINSLENDIKNTNRIIKENKTKWQDLKTRYESQDTDDTRSILSDQLQNRKTEVNRLDRNRIHLIEKIAKSKAELSVLKDRKEKYDSLNASIRTYDLFLQATSKRGIPVQIINSLLPKINIEISKILKGVVGFTVELEADTETNSMDIYINYGDSKRIIELGSGMEKMISSLAIRVALINVSSLPKTSMLIIDEGFGSLDETNLESCGNLLKSLKKWFKNIIVISHIDEIKDIVDNTIDIRKRGPDSYVNQN